MKNILLKKSIFPIVSVLCICSLLIESISAYNGKNPDTITYGKNDYSMADHDDDLSYTGRSYSVTVNSNIPKSQDSSVSYTVSGNVLNNISGNLTFSHWHLKYGSNEWDALENDTMTTDYDDICTLISDNNANITATAIWNNKVVLSNLYSVNNTSGNNKLTLPGYTFKGYLNNGTYIKDITVYPDTSAYSMTLTGDWEANKYKVTFNNNSPSAPAGYTNSVINSTSEQEVVFNSKYGTLPTPTVAGYTFKGWLLDTSSNSYHSKGKTITSSTYVETYCDHSLKAIWEANRYLITFNYNASGLSSAVENNSIISTTVTYDKTYDEGTSGSLPMPTSADYEFLGWYTAASGGTQVTNDTVVRLTGNQTLYAHWKRKSYDVTFDYNSPDTSETMSGNALTSTTVTYGKTYGEGTNGTLPTPSITGYIFNGWYTAQTGGTQITNDTVVTLNANQTLYAHWTAKTYSVTFDYNKPSVSPTTISGNTIKSTIVTYNKKYGEGTNGLLPTPIMGGYQFDGWYTSNNGGTLITNDTVVKIIGPQTLYAHWTPLYYSVIFDYNDGGTLTYKDASVTGTNITKANTFSGVNKTYVLNNITGNRVYDGTEYHKVQGKLAYYRTQQFAATYGTLPNITLKGWTFNNWILKTNGSGSVANEGTAITSSSKVTTYGTHILVANWTANKYKIEFNPNLKEDVDVSRVGTIPSSTYIEYDNDEYVLKKEYATQYNKSYNVTFNPKGGTFSDGTTANKTISSEWKVSGWLYDSNGLGNDDSTKIYYSNDNNKKSLISTYNSNEQYFNYSNEANKAIVENSKVYKSTDTNYTVEKNTDFGPATKWINYNQSGDSYLYNDIKIRNLSDVDNSKIVLYATWSPDYIKLPSVENNDLFLGWFTVEQSAGVIGSNLTYEDVYVGKAGDLVAVNNNTTLYAWWNKAPIPVDILDGQFWEGQTVTYNDLLNLVTAYDEDDPVDAGLVDAIYSKSKEAVNDYYDEQIDTINSDIEFKNTQIANLNMLIENARLYGENYYSLQSQVTDINASLVVLNEKRETLQEERVAKLDELKERSLCDDIRIVKVEYYYSGSDTADEIDTEAEISNSYTLKTGTLYSGKIYEDSTVDTPTQVIITYQFKDKGIQCGDTVLSPIIVNYSKTCEILHNYNPILSLQNLIDYNTTEFDSSNKLSDYIISMQAVKDSEDLQNNIPWWLACNKNSLSVGDAETKNEVIEKITGLSINDETAKDLQKTMVITGIPKIIFKSAYYYEVDSSGEYINKDKCDEFISKYVSSEQDANYPIKYPDYIENDNHSASYVSYNKNQWLDRLYEEAKSTVPTEGKSSGTLWDGIESISITLDAHDQWGKYCSDSISNSAASMGVTTNPRYYTAAKELIGSGLNGQLGYELKEKSGDAFDNLLTYQTEGERTINFILVNLDTESELLASNVQEKVKYINATYIDTLDSNNYWGIQTNKEALAEIFNIRYSKNGYVGDEEDADYSATYQSPVKNTPTTINIYDYTKE